MARWQGLSRTAQALLLGAAALLASLATFRDELVTPLWDRWTERQPQHDARLLSSLEAGILLDEFSARLGRSSERLLRRDVPVAGPSGEVVVARDELFRLDTAHVEAFVDDSQTVLAYAVTVVAEEPPNPVTFGGVEIRFGETTLAEAADAVGPIEYVAGACGVHVEAYYEVSHNSNAQNVRRIAVGHTTTGFPALDARSTRVCPQPDASPWQPRATTRPSTDGLYVVDTLVADEARADDDLRRTALVNTVAVTASGYELAPEMISLHPDFFR